MHHRWVITALLGAVTLTACGGKEEPQEPIPTIDQDSLEAARRAEAEAEARRSEEARARAEANERARAEAELRRAREILLERVHFDFDEAQVEDEAVQLLTQKAAVLRDHPQVRLRIAGHADERGSTEYNLALGQRRAQTVKEFLGNYGLDGSRFEVVSYGEERPLDPSSNERAWAQNRRAEFTIISGESSLNP